MLERSEGNLAISELCPREKIRSIFSLREIIAIRIKQNFKTQEVDGDAKILHFKLGAKEIFQLNDTGKIIARDDHVINVE